MLAFLVVISKFHYGQELCPVIQLRIHKNTKIYFYYTILSFSLPICLRMKCGRKLSFDVKKVTEQRAELGY